MPGFNTALSGGDFHTLTEMTGDASGIELSASSATESKGKT